MSRIAAVLRRPFAEQVAAFRLRLGDLRGTRAWTDLWQAQHDRAFVVAGAMKADLLADLAAAVDRAIAEGMSLETFRKDFRSIVERQGWHGWTGEGTRKGEAWRTRVIYRTNAATSYAAGRWAQIVKAGFPLVVYRHGNSLEPRLQHLGWDGLVLPVDHPFWATHAPPNGWGCSCYVAGARSLQDAVRKGGRPGMPPPEGWDRTDARTGAPPGIDRGWAYAPGASVADVVAAAAAKVPRWPYEVAKAFMGSVPAETADALARAYRALPSTADDIRRYAAAIPREGGLEGAEAMRTLGLTTAAQRAELGPVAAADLAGFDFALDPTGVRHVFNSHGTEATEAPRGQRAVTADDFARLTALVDDPDAVADAGTGDGGLRRIELRKAFGAETLVALFEVRPSRRRLMLVTMWVMAGPRN